MLNKDLKKFRERVVKGKDVGLRFANFYLLANPFPTHNVPQFNLFVDHDDIKESLIDKLSVFNRDVKSQTTLVIGGHGAGKTSLLQYFLRAIQELNSLKVFDRIHPILYIQQPGDSFLELHREIVSSLSRDFLESVCEKLNIQFRKTELDPTVILENLGINNSDLAKALFAATGGVVSGNLRLIEDTAELVWKRRILEKWLSGEPNLTKAEKEVLNVDYDITTSSLAIEFLGDVVKLLQKLELCRGVVLLIDELELIFSRRLSPAHRERFIEDLRHFIESMSQGLFMVFCSTSAIEDPHFKYPALLRRLGYQQALTLDPILTKEVAIQFATEFIEYGRQQFFEKEAGSVKAKDKIKDPLFPLTRKCVVEIFEEMRTSEEVLPGFFLPRLHDELNTIALGKGK